jgi:acetyltransferase-like isoleucine patch superfamily enzyme
VDHLESGSAGVRFTSRETGVEPDIHPSVLMDAMIDCIHKVTIEADAFSGHDVMILTGSHDPTTFGAERRVTSGGGPVTIKEGAWLCTRSIIVGPVTVGRFAVVAAGAVVVDDVPDYALVAGVPAKVVKYYDHE